MSPLSLFAENRRIPRQSFVYRLLQHFEVLLVVNAAEQGLAHDSAIAVKDIGGGERHDAQRKRSGFAARVKVDVAVIRAGHFEQLLRGFNALLVAVQRFHVDADDLAALLLDALIQRAQVIQLLNAGLAAVEPEVHNREGIGGKQAVIHVVAIQIFSRELREGVALRRILRLAGRIVFGNLGNLFFNRPNLLRKSNFPAFSASKTL